MNPTLLALGSVVIVSMISLVGILSFYLAQKQLSRYLLLLVSLSAGTLLGGAFLHLLPEAVGERGFTLSISFAVLAGILVFFVLEKYIQWRHCHVPTHKGHQHHIGTLNLIGDGLHNFLDGIVIAGSYLASVPAGIATTIAVVLHEVPQEISDFGVLMYSGLSKGRALFYNFLSAMTAILGAVLMLTLGSRLGWLVSFIVPFAAGGFVYIATADLIPELQKKCDVPRESFAHLAALVVGIALMFAITFLE